MSEMKATMRLVTEVSRAAECLEAALAVAKDTNRDDKVERMLKPMFERIEELLKDIIDEVEPRYDY